MDDAKKPTPAQRRVLERMAAGEAITESPYAHPRAYRTLLLGGERVSRIAVDYCRGNGWITMGYLLTEAGRAVAAKEAEK